MASPLLLPSSTRPANLRLPDNARIDAYDADLYNICNRIREEVERGERLYITLQKGHPQPWVVMEECDDGWDRMVIRAEELDARVISRCQYLIKVPVAQRVAMHEALEEARTNEARKEELDALYEEMGRPMWTQLEHDGFIDGRNRSYPKARRKRPKGLAG